MSSVTPLGDRMPSNTSNDPHHEWQSPTTTPLRIAKRDSPQRGNGLTRRQSSSYKHLKNNHLVSKSPFRSLIPTPNRPTTFVPSPRRVSGEKRSRPVSMHEQAENEYPLGFKRRQSRGFQGLLEKEPVTKSPFKHSGDSDEKEPSPPSTVVPARKLRKKAPVYEETDVLPPPPPPKHALSSRASPRPAISPARPSLVSKRLHGPRENGMFGRKARRKTVTFDERCDVMEFSAEEDLEVDGNPTDWTTDTDDEDDGRTHYQDRSENHDANESFDSTQAGDDSLTGLVDSMLQDNEPHTPTHQQEFPADLEHEDGIPYGRTHHADRAAVVHNLQRDDDDSEAFDAAIASHSGLSTPPQSCDTPPIGALSPGSHIPLGRSTHSERQRAHKAKEHAGVDQDVQMLPPSPSPAKRTAHLPVINKNIESLIPKFDIGVPGEDKSGLSDLMADVDPFGAPLIKDEPELDGPSFMSAQLIDQSGDPEVDPTILSVGSAEVSLTRLDVDEVAPRGSTEEHHLPPATSTPPTSPPSRSVFGLLWESSSAQSLNNLIDLDSPPPAGPFGSLRSNSPRSGSPALGQSSRSGSPFARNASPLHDGPHKSASQTSLHSPSSSLTGRSPRITREDVHRRLLTKRSIESPLRDIVDVATSNAPTGVPERRKNSASRSFPRPLSRDNPTYDGVMSIDPDPQPIDPPRPSLKPRSHSIDNLLPQPAVQATFEGLQVDFSSGFDMGDVGMDIGNGLGMSLGETPLGDMRSALDRLMEDVAGEASTGPEAHTGMRLKIESVTAGVQAGHYQRRPEPVDPDASHEQSREISVHDDVEMPARDLASPPLDLARPVSPVIPPPLPVKDARRAREELYVKKKREARQQKEDEDLGLRTPPRSIGIGRPSRRRSRRTDNTGDLQGHKSSDYLLDDVPVGDTEDQLGDSINRELRKLGSPSQKSKYHVRERSETIYASADAVEHTATTGGVNGGKAWKTVRRPSDMNEYAQELKALKAAEGTACPRIFVKVIGVRNLIVPLPKEPTAVSCTLNNGIHFVTTPECPLQPNCDIGQEFELVGTKNLEFTLTLKVRRDPHILAQFRANVPPRPVAPIATQPLPPASKGGMRNFFLGSPKKPSKVAQPQTTLPSPLPVHRLQENLARYLEPDGSLCRAFFNLQDIRRHCELSLFKTACPVYGHRLEPGGHTKSIQVGELLVSMFMIPALQGLHQNDLPQSLEECHRGWRQFKWHHETYYEGTLTQSGGDCVTWRRRRLRIMGSNLVAFNDVTKKATAAIDLRKAVSVQDDEISRNTLLSPSSEVTSRYSDDYEYPYGVERSFRLLFANNEEILFFADNDEEKASWLQILRALVGNIPPKPLWAAVAHQHMQERLR